jgi:hypothetical protein
MLLLITEMDEGDPEFQQLTEEEIASSVVMASAVEEGSDIELNEPQEFTIKLLSSARDSVDAVISYLGSSTNRELQAYYEHLSTVREILINGQRQGSVYTELDGFLKPALLRSETSTTSESSADE